MDTKLVKEMLERVGLTSAEVTVYLTLLRGALSASGIAKKTGEKRPTVYYALGTLCDKGLISRTGKQYGNTYRAESLDALEELVREKMRAEEELLQDIAAFKKRFSHSEKQPKVLITHFDTLEAIRLAVFESLYTKEKVLRTIVPGNNFFHDLGVPFVKQFVIEKNKRSISTKALWEDIPSKQILTLYYENAGVRQLPVSMHNAFETTILMYDNTTLYVAPKKELYAVRIDSQDHARMMRALFETVWGQGSEILK